MFRIKKDDQVYVLAGKDRGKKGKVMQVNPEAGRVVVEGVNFVKKHMRRTQENPEGAILSIEAALPVSRVMPICPKCTRGVRVGFKVLTDGTKVRYCRKCEEEF